jgi:hypothetical protein
LVDYSACPTEGCRRGLASIGKVKLLNITVSDQMAEQIEARAAERSETIQDYIAWLIRRDIDPERAAVRRFVDEVFERDGEWLERWERL